MDEAMKKQTLFKTIFSLYRDDISSYELKNRKLTFRVTEKQYQKFMELEGKNKTEKFINLLNRR